MRVAVLGQGGFLGGHLANRLVADGHDVVGVDIKPLSDWWQNNRSSVRKTAQDLRDLDVAVRAIEGCDWVFHLACAMGGRGYIDSHEADCAVNAVLDLNVLRACVQAGVKRIFYASTACVYPAWLQQEGNNKVSLSEKDADDDWGCDGAYGYAKMYGEMSCKAFAKDYGLDVRIGRFHGVYGPYGDWGSGREKAPAAVMRKVALAAYDGRPIPVWGDGTARRSFMYVDDAVEGMIRLMRSDYAEPVNLGSEEMVTINDLVDMAASVAGLSYYIVTHEDGPVGVHGRSSDNTLVRKVLEWEPSISLTDGLGMTYPWIAKQVEKSDPASL